MLPVRDYLYFVDESLEGMLHIVSELGDQAANQAPDLDGANSPYAILFHCLGVIEYWAGQVVAGRPTQRDRPAEFRATGSVADISARVAGSRRQLEIDLAQVDPLAPPRGKVNRGDTALPLATTQEGALLHVLDELSRHRGQMELTRDLLRSDWVRTGGGAAGGD